MILVLIVICILAFAAIGYKSLVFVEKNEEAVIERFGEFNRVVGEGTHLMIPFFEKLHGLQSPENYKKILNNGKISLEPDYMDFPKDDRIFFGKDKAQLKLKAQIVYQITDPYKAVYESAYLFDTLNQLFSGILQKRLIDAPDGANSTEYLKTSTENILGIANDFSTNWGVKILEFNLKQITETNGIRHIY